MTPFVDSSGPRCQREGAIVPDRLVTLVVALDDSGRVQALERRLADLGISSSRVCAVDGRALSADQLRRAANLRAGRILYGQQLTATQVGCALSHRLAYRLLVDSGAEWALVLEDDARPTDAMLSVIEQLTVLNYGAPVVVELFSEGRVNRSTQAIDLWEGQAVEKLATFPGFTVAYLINRQAAEWALTDEGPIASRADWPPWAVGVDFWRTVPNVVAHGVPGIDTTTMVQVQVRESPVAKVVRWLQLASGIAYLRLRSHYRHGLRQYYGHAVKPTAVYRLQRIRSSRNA